MEFSRPKPVHIDITITLTVVRGATPSKVESEIEARIISYLSPLIISEEVIFSRIVKVAIDVEGVYDMDELVIKAYRREGEEVTTSTRENIKIGTEEMAVARSISVLLKMPGGAG